MNRAQLEHLIRAAAELTDDDELIVVGSQAILGAHPDGPRSMRTSMAADLYPRNHPERAGVIDGGIGEISPFHEMFGYYAQGVGPETAVLGPGWQERLIPIHNENTRGATGWCSSRTISSSASWLPDGRRISPMPARPCAITWCAYGYCAIGSLRWRSRRRWRASWPVGSTAPRSRPEPAPRRVSARRRRLECRARKVRERRLLVLSLADEDPVLPAPWDNPAWFGYCLAYTDATSGLITTGCLGEFTNPPSEGHVLGEGAPMRILDIRPSGERPGLGWWDRPAFLRGFTADVGGFGYSFDYFWAGPSPGLGPVSASIADSGWGMNPGVLRPDGDDTFARDWVAAYTMKTSTARNGVLVSFDNHNRADRPRC
jgi:hypothetical protein